MKRNITGLILLILVMLLNSCGSSDSIETPTTPATPIVVTPTVATSATTIELNGRIANWNQSGETLSAFAGTTGPEETKVAISDDGDFSIAVNQPTDLTIAQPFGVLCSASEGNVSISNATSYHLLNLIVSGGLGAVHLSSFQGYTNIFNIPVGTSVKHVDLYYFSNDATVKGEESCVTSNFGAVNISYDLDIKEGWNSLVLTGSNQNDLLTISGEIAEIPDNVDWYLR